ncbi:ABC transporter ATP-binding protein [Aquipuribacter hungaricus]|uniref:ABC transporter ATP-binding protein n=1 Tax=Aquipuribacter hungaricus TaxID=545624 RepID=UPI003619BD24
MPDAPTFREGLTVVARGIRDEPRTFALAVVGSAVFGASLAGSGWVLGQVTDRYLVPAFRAGEVEAGQAWAAAGAMALVGTLTAIGVIVRRGYATVTQYRLQARYRRSVSRQYLRLPLAWHHRHPTGQVLSNANADVEAAFAIFAPLPFSFGVVVMLFVAGFSMFTADPVLASVAFVVLPLLVVANGFYQRAMAPRVAHAQQLRADVSDVAHESFEGALVVKTLGRETEETERFAARAHELRRANVSVGRARAAFEPVIEALPTLGTLVVLAVGTLRVSSGAIEAGTVVQVAYQLTLLAFPVRAIGWVLAELPRAAVGWRRVGSVLDATGRMQHGSAALPAAPEGRELVVRGLDHDVVDPDGSVQRLLHGIDMDVPAGSTVAVVGSTGSGKSTLTSLLVRLVDPVSGRVSLDGTDVRDVAPGGLSASVAYVPQTTFVFDDTVRGNITLGLEDGPLAVGDDEVWAALRAARAESFVAALPAGLDTRVGERGASLSGGQRQRLAIARALVRRPSVLVLDDATSAVDPTVEREILDGLRDTAGVTVVVVAYRRSTIALADQVVHVEHGRVVDRGTHEELMSRDETYRHLVEAYARDAAEREKLAAGGKG